MSPSPRRRLPRSDRESELLAAGEREIRRLGAATRVEDVVKAAGAAKGTFYVYFATWEDFLFALRERVFAQLDARFAAWTQAAPDWVERIGGLPELFVDMTLGLEGLHQAVLHGPIGARPPRSREHDVIQRLADLLEEGVAAGALAVEDPPQTARLVFALLHETADLVERGQARGRAVAAARAFLLRAVSASQAAGRTG